MFNILKEHSLVPQKYENRGQITIVTTNKGKYVLKKNKTSKQITDYLKARNFDYIPQTLDDNEYTISKYIDELQMPKEQKMLDLIELTALLHNKTTHFKEIDLSYYTTLYEDLENNINYLYGYYTDIINLIESKVFMSPSEYLLARNINIVYDNLSLCHELLEEFYKEVKEKRKQRLVVLHNNLDLSHYIRNDNSYLISWDKAKIDIPIFDLYKLYKKYVLDFEFSEILETYEKHYPLFDYEKLLLFTLILMPNIVNFNDDEYEVCLKITKEIDSMIKTKKLVLPYYTNYRNNKENKENK